MNAAARLLPPDDWPLRALSRIESVAPHHWHVQMIGTGADVLFLHGAGASAHSWHKLVPHLEAYCRMILPDLPGHAFTRSPKGRASLPQVAKDMGALLARLDSRPRTIIGHSAGAAIGLEMIRQGIVAPDRIVVINGALEDFKGTAGWLFPMVAKVMALSPFTGAWLSQRNSPEQVRSLIGSTGTDLDEQSLRLYGRLVARQSHVEGTLGMMAQWSLADLSRALPQITTPATFLHGERDQAVSIAVAERAVAAMPNAGLFRLPGIGHIAQEEAPDRVAAEILSVMETQASAAE